MRTWASWRFGSEHIEEVTKWRRSLSTRSKGLSRWYEGDHRRQPRQDEFWCCRPWLRQVDAAPEIAGLEEVTEGDLKIGERVVNSCHPQGWDIAMVFQNYALYSDMSVSHMARAQSCAR